MKVFFGTQVIQKGRRIAIGENTLENLGLNVGDTVKIYLDTDLMCLMIEPLQQKTVTTRRLGKSSPKT